MVQTQQITEVERSRAAALAQDRKCPHCGEMISLTDSISLVQGHGFERWVQVRLADGRIMPMRASDVNPQTMLVVEE